MSRIARILTVAAAMGLFLVPSVASAQYPPAGTDLTLSPSSVVVGGSFSTSGEGCGAGQTVTVRLGSSVLGNAIADSEGAFSFTGVVPSGTAVGTYTITSTCLDPAGDSLVLSATLTVAALGTTGSNTSTLLYVALGLLILGGSALAFGKRDSARA